MGLASLCLRRRKQDFFLTSRGDTVRMKYSSLLQIVKHADYTVVTIVNPWDTLKVLHTYLLADRGKTATGTPARRNRRTYCPCRSRSSIRLYTAACGLNSTS